MKRAFWLVLITLMGCSEQVSLDADNTDSLRRGTVMLPEGVEYLGTVDGCSIYRLPDHVYVVANMTSAAHCGVAR